MERQLGDFMFTINGVIPLFVLVAVGYWVRDRKLLGETSIQQLNQLCFKLLLPCSLFHSAAISNIRDSANLKLLGYMIATYVISVAVLCLVIPKILPSRRQCGAVVHASFRANTILF
ncbi:MAG: AEC family transporter, partial [Oscillospiraceae bacterium]